METTLKSSLKVIWKCLFWWMYWAQVKTIVVVSPIHFYILMEM